MHLPINLLTLTIKTHLQDLNLLRILKMRSRINGWLCLSKGLCPLTPILTANLIIGQLQSEESRDLMNMQTIKKECSLSESNHRLLLGTLQ